MDDEHDNSGPPPRTKQEIADDRVEFLKRHVSQLSEHFDTVQIVCLKLNADGGTTRYQWGSGILHARVKSCEAFVASRNTTSHL